MTNSQDYAELTEVIEYMVNVAQILLASINMLKDMVEREWSTFKMFMEAKILTQIEDTLDNLEEKIFLLLDKVATLEVSLPAIDGNSNRIHAPVTSLSRGKIARRPGGPNEGGCNIVWFFT